MQPRSGRHVTRAMERIQLWIGEVLIQALLEVMHGLAVGVLEFLASSLLGS